MENINIKDIIRDCDFHFNKNLGQNFVSDGNLLDAIVSDSGINENDTVVEIGTGAGTLTRALAKKAKRVVSFEVDHNLEKVLNLSLQGVENAEVVFRDILKMNDSEIEDIVGGDFKVVANLPYYITTPLAMRFLESTLPVKSLTIMVQKEVADRFVAKAGSKDYAAITLAIEMAGDAKITRNVSRQMFFPAPNVDSAVVRIDINRDKLAGKNTELISKLVHAAFLMRRKTLVNNLSTAFGISKEETISKIEKAGFSSMIRGEALSLQDYIRLSEEF
ncbi:MAG: 16S rRNA (adenine(1518)-N(6)/adenine(1519)-N(6))-dimethyltransferase RsmA [Clostridia bacterium]|nr:16S rRNA (adenine(1518)-N(6)/adenine(1519)-N(6))-dimethyltransferase RsmA [Clostridia bacterium]